MHLYREQDAATLILDEPDVYLHPDLQRKPMRLLLHAAPQIIVATQSQEMVMEAGTEALTWVNINVARVLLHEGEHAAAKQLLGFDQGTRMLCLRLLSNLGDTSYAAYTLERLLRDFERRRSAAAQP